MLRPNIHSQDRRRTRHFLHVLHAPAYLPGGDRAKGNGELIEAMAKVALDAGRSIASPAEAREIELGAAAFSGERIVKDASAGAHIIDL